MTSSKVTPVLLAASVALAGIAGALLGSFAPVQAITSVDELSDVNNDHWAYDALRDLVEKYDVIEGYPDQTFRGDHKATRYEMAAALNKVIKAVGRDLARLGAEKANKSDLQTLARLQEEFRNELAALEARTSALESRAAAIEAKNEEQDVRLSLLEKTQIHGDATLGAAYTNGSQGFGGRDDVLDSYSAMGRVRLALEVPVVEPEDPESKIGEGTLHTRLIGSFGNAFNNIDGAAAGASGLPFSAPNRVGIDASSFNEGVFNGGFTGGSAFAGTRATAYVEAAFYKQQFNGDIPFITDLTPGFDLLGSDDEEGYETSGELYAGLVRWWDIFDASPYRGDETTQFLNNSFINTPGISVNVAQPMLAHIWKQGLGGTRSVQFAAGVGSPDVFDQGDFLNVTYEGKFNYSVADHPGSVYVGGYNIFTAGNSNFNNVSFGAASTATNRVGGAFNSGFDSDSANAGYLGWNQEWYKGIGTSFSYLYNSNSQSHATLFRSLAPTPGTTTFYARQSVSAVSYVPMSLFGVRENDAFGIGYAAIDVEDGSTAGLGSTSGEAFEQVVEAYYKAQLNDSINLIPSVQVIANPSGATQNGLITVLSARMNFFF